MADFLNPDLLRQFDRDRPMPISQLFVTVVNETAELNPGADRAEVVAAASLAAIAALEHKLSEVIRVIGAVEVPTSEETTQLRILD